MLSRRGGIKAAATHQANHWQHQKRIGELGRLTRSRQSLPKKLALLEADWVRVFGETLLEHLLRSKARQD